MSAPDSANSDDKCDVRAVNGGMWLVCVTHARSNADGIANCPKPKAKPPREADAKRESAYDRCAYVYPQTGVTCAAVRCMHGRELGQVSPDKPFGHAFIAASAGER